MGHVGRKLYHQIRFVQNLVHPPEAAVLLSIFFFTGMCTIVISRLSLNMYYVGSKTRSPDKIPLKPCSPSRGHSFALIFMELYQKVCLMMSWSSLNMGHVGSKRRSLGQICFKFCSPLEALVLLQS